MNMTIPAFKEFIGKISTKISVKGVTVKLCIVCKWGHTQKVITNQLEPPCQEKIPKNSVLQRVGLVCLWNVFIELIIECP